MNRLKVENVTRVDSPPPMHAELRLAPSIKIGIATSATGRFRGFGQVQIAGYPLRSGRLPWFAQISTPRGIDLVDFRLRELVPDAAGNLSLTFDCDQRLGGRMEWMLHATRLRRVEEDWAIEQAPARHTSLTVRFAPVQRCFGSRRAIGFSYQFAFQSATHHIYHLLDRGSWEPGGAAVGNAIWMRGGLPVIQPIQSPEQRYSTEWYLPAQANPSIFQFMPLQTHLQGFTFTPGPRGVLITLPTQLRHIRSLIQKPAGGNEIMHLHEHCDDLGPNLTTSPMEVLWVEGRFAPWELANLYEHVRTLVSDLLHAQADIQPERITTYGLIEEWGNADLADYARRGLPKLLDAGCKTIGLANHFANNMNTFGISNMCCTYDWRVAESVGAQKLQAFCRQAHAGGAAVQMWANTACSTLTLMLDRRSGRPARIAFPDRADSLAQAIAQAADPFVRTPSGAIDADHYTPVFAVLNLRDPTIRDFWLKSWSRARTEVGLDSFFLDSSFNLTNDKFHWLANPDSLNIGATIDQENLLGFVRQDERPGQIQTMYFAHLELVRQMQALGYTYTSEDLGIFGTHRTGPGAEKRLDNLFLWGDCLANFDAPRIASAGGDPADVFFRGLAYRLVWILHWLVRSDQLSFRPLEVRDPADVPTTWHLQLLRAFNQCAADMRQRTILPGETGVLYQAATRRVLWSFVDQNFPLDGPATVHDLITGATMQTASLHALRHHVYVLSTPAD